MKKTSSPTSTPVMDSPETKAAKRYVPPTALRFEYSVAHAACSYGSDAPTGCSTGAVAFGCTNGTNE